jgi:hypothetical protein
MPAFDSPDGTTASQVDGDVSTHLEDLVVGPLEPLVGDQTGQLVEFVGPHLRLSATLDTGQFRRLSDFLNHHEGLIVLRDATVLRRNGDPTKVVTPSIWVSPNDVTLVAQPSPGPADEAPADMRIAKVARPLIVVTPGHTLTGEVYLQEEASLAIFIESDSPPFIPMTDVRTRSLADRRVIARYPFALLNRRHIVAATPLQPGMAPGKMVL